MGRNNLQKRRDTNAAARERQARRRARMSAIGRPDSAATDRAIVEALSFTMASTKRTTSDPHDQSANVSTLVRTALTILADREGYDRRESAAAIKLRLDRRSEHLEPSYLPSFNADADRQLERIRMVSTARQEQNAISNGVPISCYTSDTPITPSNGVTKISVTMSR